MLKNINSRIFTSSKFLPLFIVQFLGATNDNLLRNAILILITFSNNYHLFGIKAEQMVNLAVFLFILPFFLLSSYAGKLADNFNKVKLVRIIKLCEIVIMLVAGIGFFSSTISLLLIALFAMGCHSAFFSPIKYSILPQYLAREGVILGTGYIQLGTFVAILLGQMLGSWLMASQVIYGIVSILIGASLIGYYYSHKMLEVPVNTRKIKFYKNVFKDSWFLYHSIILNKMAQKNMHAISWFWAMGVIYTSQLPTFTLKYLGGNAHVFSLLLVLFSISIGLGSIYCAKKSKGQVIHCYAIVGALCISIFSITLLLSNRIQVANHIDLLQFFSTWHGIGVAIQVFLIGFFAGFYSLTCYAELQLTAADCMHAQVMAANNILNAIYMLVTSIVSLIILFFANVWQLILLAAILNLIFCLYYYKQGK